MLNYSLQRNPRVRCASLTTPASAGLARAAKRKFPKLETIRLTGSTPRFVTSSASNKRKKARGTGVETANDMQAAGPLGRVLSVTGSQAQVRLAVDNDVRATVGKFLGIRAGVALVIGVITKIALDQNGEFATGALDMLGEIKDAGRGRLLPARRHRLSDDRRPGDVDHDASSKLIFTCRARRTIEIGRCSRTSHPRLHQCRRHAAQALRGPRHDRRRQVERRRAASCSEILDARRPICASS